MLRGISEDQQYEMHFVDKDMKIRLTGRELMEKGLLLEEDTAPESVLVAYEVVK
jgi:hypothetical protein